MTFLQTLFVTTTGILLTAILGNWISHSWQMRNWKNQQKYGQDKEILQRQLEIAEGLSNLVGRRRYRMFRAVAALRKGERQRIDDIWKDYDVIVVEWNDNVNGYISKLRHFFGRKIQYDFDSYITEEFQYLGALLERAKKRHDSKMRDSIFFEDLLSISKRLELFGGQANEFTGSLWRHIDGLKNKIDGQPEINFDNHDSLGYIYLIKRIFARSI